MVCKWKKGRGCDAFEINTVPMGTILVICVEGTQNRNVTSHCTTVF